MIISLIAAVGKGGVIGRKGKIPWKLSTDLKRFAALTKGHVVIAGRKTHEAIIRRLGRPLSERTTIVVTRQKRYRAHGCLIAHSLTDAFHEAEGIGEREAFVIGGGTIYAKAIPYAKRLYVTEVHGRCAGDTHFPYFPKHEWTLISSTNHPRDSKNDHAFTFTVYERSVYEQWKNVHRIGKRARR